MQMVAAVENSVRGVAELQMAGGAVPDVEDEVTAAVLAVGDERGAGRHRRVRLDCRHIDAVGAQAFDVELAEIVIADAADHGARLTKPGDLIDEDGGRAARERALERARREKRLAAARGQYLDQNLPDGDDRLHALAPLEVPPHPAGRFLLHPQ